MKRRDNMNTKVIHMSALCVLVSLATLFTACDVLGPEPAPEPEPAPVVAATPDEKALVSVRVGMWGRTVMPTVGLEYVDSWELLGAKTGNQEDSLLVFTTLNENATIALEPGTWSFTLKGVRAGVLALSGSIEDKAISLEGENILAFYVEPAESGEGTVTLVIKLPAGSGITEAKVFKDGVEHGSPIEPVDDTIAFTETSLTGAYYYSFKLYNAEPKLLGVVSEIVYVWKSLESAKTYTLLQKDLNLTYTISYHDPHETIPDDHYQIATAVTLPTPSSREDYYFKGWYERAEEAAENALSGDAVTRIPLGSTGDREFYSRWIPKTFSGYTLAQALAVIRANAEANDVYTIIVNADESLAPQTLFYDGKTVSITLLGATTDSGDAKERKISLSEPGSLLTLGSGARLTLDSNITLLGLSDNTASLVAVNSGARLTMKAGVKISDNTAVIGVSVGSGGMFTMTGGEISNNGGGVGVGGSFTMTGGTISGNTATNGGGVSVSGSFSMSGGTISDNIATSQGGGVRMSGSGFYMTGGTISGNSAPNGGGVYLFWGWLTMTGGTISGNSASSYGGGVGGSGGTIGMQGGTISNNTASGGGGGVHSVLTMTGGTISGNTATNGGGVYGTLTMSGGTISGNKATSNGGGAYGNVTKSGGTVYGSEAEEPLKNTAGSGAGHAAYAAADKVRDSTAGAGADLDSAESGAAGGWELPGSLSPSQSLEWIRANAGDGDVYTVTLNKEESLAPQEFSYDDKAVSIILVGDTEERIVKLSENGSLFTVGKGVTLTLDSNITLEGLSDNNAALVMVHSGGALKMKADSKISNNTISSGVGGGGVIVNGNGTFTMDGGEISNNTVSGGGGGVYVASNATFTMNKGNISNNTGDSGGGVHISISGTFILNDGNISGNTAFRGSGVYISTSGKFTMNKGNISNNTATDHGGGVFAYAGSFTMNNGNISDNTAANDGGGVYLNNANGGAKFTMSGGAISGNTASSGNGGGVLVKGSLTKQAGGVIYGSEAGEPLKNIAGSGAGHAVYVAEDKKRDSTAGEGVTLSSGSLDNWE